MKISLFAKLALAASVLALSGCQHFIQNETPAKIPANASDIYTFSVKVNEAQRKIVPKSLKVQIVINGETIDMKRDEAGKEIWSIDYPVASNVAEAAYYFIVRYATNEDGVIVKHEEYSTDFTGGGAPHKSSIMNRYVIRIASSRAPVGAMIAVVGQGFSENDTIMVGDAEAKTTIVSRSHLNFIVPNLPAGQSYEVKLHTQSGDVPAGRLRIDTSTIGVQPNTISIKAGDSLPLTFFIDTAAPAGGLTIDVSTNIPACIVMPVVTIPEGQRSVSVTVQGSASGNGFLIISAPGYEKARIPVTIE
jgi:hypothetical protein